YYYFNKSHAAAYGLITCQTAWLKAHYPVEFMAALLTSEKDNTDKVVAHIAEARADGITVLPPDVNDSDLAFGVGPDPKKTGKKLIRFGLGAIKGVGENSIEGIISARDKPFAGLFDFCGRIDTKKINRKTLEALVAAGAFDFTGKPRKALWDAIEPALAQGSSAQKDRESGQFGLFSTPATRAAGAGEPPPPEERVFGKEEWSVLKRFEELLKGDDPVLVRGAVRLAEKFGAEVQQDPAAEPTPEIKVDEVSRLSEVRAAKATRVELKMPVESATPERLTELKSLLGKHAGTCSASLVLVQSGTAETRIALKAMRIAPDDDLFAAVDRLFGQKV